jgi:hypothetical protein
MVSAQIAAALAGDLGRSSVPKHVGRLPVERLLDGPGCIEAQADTVLPVGLCRIGRRFGVGHVEVAVAERRDAVNDCQVSTGLPACVLGKVREASSRGSVP